MMQTGGKKQPTVSDFPIADFGESSDHKAADREFIVADFPVVTPDDYTPTPVDVLQKFFEPRKVSDFQLVNPEDFGPKKQPEPEVTPGQEAAVPVAPAEDLAEPVAAPPPINEPSLKPQEVAKLLERWKLKADEIYKLKLQQDKQREVDAVRQKIVSTEPPIIIPEEPVQEPLPPEKKRITSFDSFLDRPLIAADELDFLIVVSDYQKLMESGFWDKEISLVNYQGGETLILLGADDATDEIIVEKGTDIEVVRFKDIIGYQIKESKFEPYFVYYSNGEARRTNAGDLWRWKDGEGENAKDYEYRIENLSYDMKNEILRVKFVGSDESLHVVAEWKKIFQAGEKIEQAPARKRET